MFGKVQIDMEDQNVFELATLDFRFEADSYFDQEIEYKVTVCPETFGDKMES